ncbi:hypothetical protein CYMTET_52419 [Cymbomonas tetramitiformis]|uniref:Uncharacterized protein n=1 Tax=Cymbomonas tetramitiformis TaxID=36881 RepID=A0AAE0BKC7_9CHLO|nr:hypothetical protein CYMTET_52419 [Cymbomonas tetramitiformis]
MLSLMDVKQRICWFSVALMVLSVCPYSQGAEVLDFCSAFVPTGQTVMVNTTNGLVEANGRCTNYDDEKVREMYDNTLLWRDEQDITTNQKCKNSLYNFLCLQCQPLPESSIKSAQTWQACEKSCSANSAICRKQKLNKYISGKFFKICC